MQKVRWFVLTLILGLFSSATAQQTTENNYLLTSISTQFGCSVLDINDGYLSDLPYSGYGLQFNNSSRRFVNTSNNKLSLRSDINLNAGVAMNKPQTASISYIGGNLGYGLQAHLKPLRNFQVLIGGEWDAEMGVKVYSRDVNNAGNLDLATNLNLAATLRYDLPILKTNLRFQVDIRSPFLGLMFVPVRGESYSEIYYLHNYNNLFHLTSLHNKNGLDVRYLLQLPLKHSILNFGLHTELLKYAANNMVFRRSITSLQLGVTYDLALFGGRRNPSPAGFISSEW